MRPFLLLVISIIFLFSCNIRKTLNPTPREKYQRNYKGPDSLLQIWQQAYEQAMLDTTWPVSLPLVMTARLNELAHSALSYRFVVNSGQELVVELDRQGDSAAYFVEIFEKARPGKNEPAMLETMDGPAGMFRTTIAETDTFNLIVQPAIANHSLFRLRIYLQPAYLFPVANKGNKAIASFWGAARDGGSRFHEGVDIFAAMGTPLLAVADGRIQFTGQRGLGGKQVWLRENEMGHNVYYAHLDSIATQRGEQVQRGDTLGFVGNTGNAITTAPHLHFGVYGENGAMDPLLYIKQIPVPGFADTLLSPTALTRNPQNELRSGPAVSFPLIYTLNSNDTVRILGKTAGWFYVVAGEEKGYMHQTLLRW